MIFARLKAAIRRWLDVPSIADLPESADRSTIGLRWTVDTALWKLDRLEREFEKAPAVSVAPKASGAMYAEIRAARAEVAALLEQVKGAGLSVRQFEGAMARAGADWSNTLREVADLHVKLDAVFECMGYAVVMGQDGTASVAPIDARAAQVRRVLDARETVRELNSILFYAKGIERDIKQRVQRINATPPAANTTTPA